ncbi:hypothetical protein Ancab_026109 [Ancistrocladus abbreviatus]
MEESGEIEDIGPEEDPTGRAGPQGEAEEPLERGLRPPPEPTGLPDFGCGGEEDAGEDGGGDYGHGKRMEGGEWAQGDGAPSVEEEAKEEMKGEGEEDVEGD